jgi:tRNA threonylcarbamoyladenosine biosynthesis protein TsaB
MTDQFACLAVETATDVCTVAAANGAEVRIVELPDPQGSVRDIYRSINRVVSEASLTLAELDCIAFGAGPGSFTGIRVAASVAQSLAFGFNLPVCRVSSLAVLAAGARQRHEVVCVAACIDARKGQAYLGVYQFAEDGTISSVIADQLVDPLAYRLDPDRPAFAAGPGWASYPTFAGLQGRTITGSDISVKPSAADLLALAQTQFRRGETVDAQSALPNYLRDRVTGT